jgi:two-component system cell cycle response regulator
MALYDPLTGLENRRSLDLRLPAMFEAARRRGSALTTMILDIDHFKRVNDTHGHDVGDLVLKNFASELQEIFRGSDLLCRLGGEEFAVIMLDVDASHVARIAERARRTIESKIFLVPTGGSVSITVSIGLAAWRSNCNWTELYRRADQALYVSKSMGRNRVTQDAA